MNSGCKHSHLQQHEPEQLYDGYILYTGQKVGTWIIIVYLDAGGEKNHTMIILVRIALFVFTEKKKERLFCTKQACCLTSGECDELNNASFIMICWDTSCT